MKSELRQRLDDRRVIILAAGDGSRMGGPKALMLVAGKPWWREQCERLDALGLRAVWVVSDAVARSMSARPGAPATLVTARSDQPMFASLLAGIRSIEHTPPRGVFILPVDVPAARSPLTWQLLAESGGCTIPSCHGVHGHPVHLSWEWVARVLLPAAAGPDAAALRLDRLLAGSAEIVDVGDPTVALNLNNPDDVRRFLESGRAGLPSIPDR